ncbi:hypothetical protein Tco_1553932 [Tanacetum coccineum]
MTTLKFADTHNMVAFLAKAAESEGFEQIVDFLNAHTIKYALTINPKIYTSCIKQFWATIKAKTGNEEVQLQALVDGKKIIITESIVRGAIQLEDAEGVDCLPNATIFEQLTLMGAKTTAWNEFSSTMASAIICLATNQKFNFSNLVRVITNASSLEAELDSGGSKNLNRKRGQELLMLKRLYKVGSSRRVESSDEDGLGEEDASKQGRIADIDANKDIYLVNVHTDEDMFGVNDLDYHCKAELKSAKPKADNVVIQEPEQGTTTTTPM